MLMLSEEVVLNGKIIIMEMKSGGIWMSEAYALMW